MDLREIWREVFDRIHLAVDKNQLRGLVNTVMNLQIPQKAGEFDYLSIQLASSQMGFCSTWLHNYLFRWLVGY
jgi:hypothetical protein